MLISLTDARHRIGVSKDTFRQLMRESRFTGYAIPRDRRSKLVDTSGLDLYLEPRVIRERRPRGDGKALNTGTESRNNEEMEE